MRYQSYVVRFWNWIDDWFVAEHIKKTNYLLYKARNLACVHLLCAILVIATSIVTIIATPENNLPMLGSALVILTLTWVFKKYGNIELSGNLLAVGFSIVLVPMTFTSGGLYSDNLLWLLMCPIVVMLFSSRKAVIVWVIGLMGFTYFLYWWDITHPGLFKSQIANLQSVYYFASYILLFLLAVFVVYLYKYAEDSIILDMAEHQKEVEAKTNEMMLINQQLRNMSDQLRRSNHDLESFAYASSHDLKEPLRQISIYTQLIQKRLKGSLTPETEEMMDFVKEGVARMQRLLEDVLEYSKIGRGQDNLKEIDLDDVLFFVRSNLRLAIQETNTTLVAQNLPKAYARYSEMVQLFQNLISNAIKFTERGIAPDIKITFIEQENHYCFFLKDNGIGIEQEFYPRIFELFERLHGRQNYQGTGIGLATCKKIVENSGGKIWLKSKLGEGTTFIFTLPKTEAHYQAIMALPDTKHEEIV